MGDYWNTALTARMVLEACEAQGVDTEPILRSVGIDRTTVEDAEGRVSLDQMRSFWQEAVAQSGDPAIGFHAGGRAPRGFYGLFDYMISYSATIGDALSRFGDYLPLINNWVTMRVEDPGDALHIVTEVVWGVVPRPSAEYIAAFLIERSRLLWANAWAPELVRFEFPEPGPSEPRGEHAQVLRCPVEFGASRTEFIISRATWDQPVRTADPGLVAMLERQAAQLIAQLPNASPLVQDVRRELQTTMAGGDQRIDEIARRLGMSGRTLQRRLADDGLTYAVIVDDVRLEAAKIALADLSMSLSHVAYFVGFEEQSSFSRAFKRWTESSPKNYRHALTSPAGRSRSDDTAIS